MSYHVSFDLYSSDEKEQGHVDRIEKRHFFKPNGLEAYNLADKQEQLAEYSKMYPRLTFVVLCIGEDGHSWFLFISNGEVEKRYYKIPLIPREFKRHPRWKKFFRKLRVDRDDFFSKI